MTDFARVWVRFCVSLTLTVLVIGVALVAPQLGGHVYSPAAQRWGAVGQLVLATPVVCWAAWSHLARNDYKDPGWYKHPQGTVAYAWTGAPPAVARTTGAAKSGTVNMKVRKPSGHKEH